MSVTTPPRTPAPPSAPLRFGRYALLAGPRQLLADGTAVPIGSRAFDLLLHLLRHADRPVGSDELQRAVWPDRRVGANNVRVQITALRKLLGAGVIAHHATQGYRLMLPVLDESEAAEGDPPPPPGNLPAHLPPLFGRDTELARLGEAIDAQARLTLAGPAGVGKTVLARAAAHARRRQRTDGVWWIELAALTEPSQLVDTIAAQLQLKLAGQSPADELARALANKDLLLVLDNCEHLVRPVCDLADTLLRHAPRVALLATSRRSLKCAGEHLQRLGPLALPAGDSLAQARRSGAIALFEARARRADAAFVLTRDNVGIVIDICRALDGIALAIGLAAARVPLLGVAGLRDLLGERMRLLSGREPDARGQPQALITALDWSHGLLSPTQQTVLRRLAVFAGSFSLLSVRTLASDAALDEWGVLDALDELIDQSLLTSHSSAVHTGADARYSLHESVRLYARARLDASGETAALRRRHALHVLDLVTGAVRPPGIPAPRDRMDITLDDADHDNLRAALAWACEHDIAFALELAVHSNPYRRLRGHHPEARRLGAQLLADARAADHPWLRGRLHLGMAALCLEQNEQDEVLRHSHAALEDVAPSQDQSSLADAWSWIGSIHLARRQFDAADAALRRSLEHNQLDGNLAGAASQMNNLALLMVEQLRMDEASAMLQQALAVNRQIDNRWGTAITLENIGELAYAVGDLDAAAAAWEEARPLIRALGHRYHESLLLVYLAQVARRTGRRDEAVVLLQASLQIALSQSLPALVADALVVHAGLAADDGRPRDAAVLLQVAERQRGDASVMGPQGQDLAAITTAVRLALGEAERQAARIEAERMTPEQALDHCGGGRAMPISAL